ncbi:MAG: c-type cytochrome [Chloroflexi bacterium]|nr:c-type cytochrome [Chloroflexota bacterium]
MTVGVHATLGIAMAKIGAGGSRAVASMLVAAIVLLVVTGCGDTGEPPHVTRESTPVTTEASHVVAVATAQPALSETAIAGEDLFNANCALCHGESAAGTTQGPTLIDRIYHPGHHSDFSFRRAVAQGVRQHHWTFGDMLPVATVTANEVEQIICYVRELQREAGIFDGDAFETVC